LFKKKIIFKLLPWVIGIGGFFWFIFFSPFLRIASVIVNPPSLAYLVEESRGENIFLFSLADKARALEEDPRIKEVRTKKLLPSTVEWKIVLRKPVLCIRKGSKWWGIDEEGMAFAVSNPVKYPILLRRGEIEGGKVYPDLKSAVLIYRDLQKEIPELMVRSIEVKSEAVIFRIGKGIKVIFAQKDVEPQIRRLKKILGRVKVSYYIDLRFGEQVIVK